MKIISHYHKKLHCQVGDKSVGIEPNQIVTVEDAIGRALIKSPWICETREVTEVPTSGPSDIPRPPDIPEFIYKAPDLAPIDEKEEADKKIEKLVKKEEEPVKEKEKIVETSKEKKVPIRKKSKVDNKTKD